MGEWQGCSSFQDGHNVHYIALLKFAPHRPAAAGTAVIDEASGRLEFWPDEATGPIGPLFNHHPALVSAALSETDGRCEWIESLRLLRVPVPRAKGQAVYSMSDKPLDMCPPPREIDAEFRD